MVKTTLIKKRIVWLSILLLWVYHQTSFAQNWQEQFNTAKMHYESGNYTAAIQQLKTVEQSLGANPKTTSLLVYAHVANNDYVNAAISLNTFKKLIGFKRNEAIQSVLNLENQINSGVETAQKYHTETVQKKRMAAARQIVDQQTTYNSNKQQVLNQQFNSAKSQITLTANPDDIASSVRNSTGAQKFELLKNLRKEKKLKKAWKVQFSDKKLDHIVEMQYSEYNLSGELIRYLSKEFGPVGGKYATYFSDFPKFEETMITQAYIDELIKTKDYTTFIECRIPPAAKTSNNYLVTRIEKTINSKSGNEIIPSNEISFKWKNTSGALVADSTITSYGNYVTIYDENTKNIKESRNYKDRKKMSEYFYDYILNGDKKTENITHIDYESSPKKTESYFNNYELNEMGDIRSSKNNWGHFESYINKYDIYGNEIYQDKYTIDYDITYSYFYNFYEYQDRYATKIADFKNQQSLNTVPKNLTAAEISSTIEKALMYKNKGYSREAKRLMEICLESDPTNKTYLYWMAAIHQEANYHDKALSYIDQLIALDPTFGPSYELKAKVYGNQYKNDLAILNYKLAADWGMSFAVKRLENWYKIKYKPDSKLLSKENTKDKELIEVKGFYENLDTFGVYGEILKVKNELYFRFAKKSADNLYTYTSETDVYEQSKKNPNVYLFKANPQYRIIISNEMFYTVHPDGCSFFKF